MKTSVLIVAHNEERYIGKCIASILDQTQKADEVIVLVHNSTDRTLEIAERYPVTVVSYAGPTGIIAARIEGLSHVTGDIVLCIDGDSYAALNWIEEMTALLQKGNVLVGSWVKFKGTVYRAIACYWNKFSCVAPGQDPAAWIWGCSFGIWGKDIEKVKRIYRDSASLSSTLKLTRNPDDYWLALFIRKEGSLRVTNKTFVVIHEKERTSWESFLRNQESLKDGAAMRGYLRES